MICNFWGGVILVFTHPLDVFYFNKNLHSLLVASAR